MEKLNHQIMELLKFVQNRTGERETFVEETKKIEQLQKKLKEMKNSIDLITRKNEQLNLEIQRLQLTRERKSSDFGKLAAEGLELSKQLVSHENAFDQQVLELETLKSSIKRLNDLEKNINFPSSNKLYIELLKGMGVDLIEKDDTVFLTVANQSTVATLDVNKEINPDEIWNLLYE